MGEGESQLHIPGFCIWKWRLRLCGRRRHRKEGTAAERLAIVRVAAAVKSVCRFYYMYTS